MCCVHAALESKFGPHPNIQQLDCAALGRAIESFRVAVDIQPHDSTFIQLGKVCAWDRGAATHTHDTHETPASPKNFYRGSGSRVGARAWWCLQPSRPALHWHAHPHPFGASHSSSGLPHEPAQLPSFLASPPPPNTPQPSSPRPSCCRCTCSWVTTRRPSMYTAKRCRCAPQGGGCPTGEDCASLGAPASVRVRAYRG